MNKFQGHISEINTRGNFSVITVTVNNKIKLKSIVIDTPESATYISSDRIVNVVFKETEVILSTDKLPAISLLNRIPGTISEIEAGELLSRVVLCTDIGPVISVISTLAVYELDLTVGCDIMAMIKLNEIILSK
ncbi:TOBE domain-containing protein [Membranihabitans maritimus]|uniref:TOBE domain-containing protein n=1 Tax=Membranihabitans maritimus TaxID=2904244 RepID=UPI001F1D2DFC|nr:TOBE domain-containing protein [Membranihabitans maritimus]